MYMAGRKRRLTFDSSQNFNFILLVSHFMCLQRCPLLSRQVNSRSSAKVAPCNTIRAIFICLEIQQDWVILFAYRSTPSLLKMFWADRMILCSPPKRQTRAFLSHEGCHYQETLAKISSPPSPYLILACVFTDPTSSEEEVQMTEALGELQTFPWGS